MSSAEAVAQRQLDAYNARDLEAWLAIDAVDARQYVLHEADRERVRRDARAQAVSWFAEPDLHAELLSRQVMASVVVDHERITRNFPEGIGTVEMLCIDEVSEGRIAKASFAMGPTRLGAP